MKLHSNTHAVISNQIGREEIHYRCCVFFLPLAALYGAQVRGGDDGSSFIIHGKIALFITEERGVYSVRRSSMYTIPPPQPLIDERRVANAKVRVWYLSLFFSVIIWTVSRRVFFFLQSEFQRTNISIVIQFKISPRVFSKLVLENQRSFVLGIYVKKKRRSGSYSM